MARMRMEIRALGATWNPTMLWYAKAVAALKARPPTSKLSWLYLAAMHGFDAALWRGFNILGAGAALPPQAEQDLYWNQCQHQTWYFLPWHRAYLLTFEDVLRAWITTQPGAPRDWAMPYWNYSAMASASNPNPRAVPDAFLARTLPDGSPNPLFIQARYGQAVAAPDADLSDALLDSIFVGAAEEGGIPGFGGPDTPFSHGGEDGGWLEDQPHNLVHVDVGGQDALGRGGLMSDPRTAAVDPIFWAHHANIDRLWEVWRRRNAQDVNPADQAWLAGPRDRPFRLYGAAGADRPSNPQDVINLVGQVYDYDDLSDPLPGARRRNLRLAALAPSAAHVLAARAPAPAEDPACELLGSSDQAVALGLRPVESAVRLAPQPLAAYAASYTPDAVARDKPGEPNRLFLKLRNIHGNQGACIFDVAVSVPGAAAAPATVGSLALFGLESASDKRNEHGGGGLTKTFEITEEVDPYLPELKTAGRILVDIRPRGTLGPDDRITVGKIDLYSLSAG